MREINWMEKPPVLDMKSDLMRFYMDKLYKMGSWFRQQYAAQNYAGAAYMYHAASTAALFLGLPQEYMYALFGHGDDGTDEIRYDEVFRKDMVHEVNWACCVRMHKGYNDAALRRAGEPVRYYSDEDYCALCRARKDRGERTPA